MPKIAGICFFVAGAVILLGILTAEILYPGRYSISQNMISNLAASPPPKSIIEQPSATILDISLIISGIMIFIGVMLIRKMYGKKEITISFICMSLGTSGVGIFPAFHVIVHPLVALLAFLAGGISAILSYKITKPPFSFIAILFGFITLVFLSLGILFPFQITALLGRGGAERWVVYPLIIWLIGLGGYLMNTQSNQHK